MPPTDRGFSVMAGLVPAIRASTCAAADGRDKPGHDEQRTVPRSPSAVCMIAALFVLLAVGMLPAQAMEPGETVQASVRLADKQLPLPRGEWFVAGLGGQALPHDAVGPFGVIRTAVLLQRTGDRVTAIAEFNTNDIAVSDGWEPRGTCESVTPELGLVRYRSRLDFSCIVITATQTAANGPPAWQQARSFIAAHHLRIAETMLTAAFMVSDRQDVVDARLHFDPALFPEHDEAQRILLAWAARFAPEFEKGMANQLSGPPLDGPLRAALLSDTPALDRRLLALETLQRNGIITAADALSQQQAAQTERPRSAEDEFGSATMDGWFYRVSTPLINFVTAYGITQSGPLAIAITLTEQVAHSLIQAANQASWDRATSQATQHNVPWPALAHIGDVDRLTGASS
jgi:hypothetical protein